MSDNIHHRLSCEDRRCQILEVAKKLFASKGFKGATTREIAQEAGVNEALIFRHFSSKQDLYWAVLEHTCDLEAKRRFIEELVEQSGTVREVFVAIAERILTMHEKDMTMMRLMFYSAMESHELSEQFFTRFMERHFSFMESYYQRLIDDGKLRPLPDLRLAVRGFIGSILYHSMVQNLFATNDAHRYTPREAAETITDCWLKGIEAR